MYISFESVLKKKKSYLRVSFHRTWFLLTNPVFCFFRMLYLQLNQL